VLVFADYTCRTLCGPTLAFVASALQQSGLHPGEQFWLLVIGLDPKDSAQDAAAMRDRYLTAGSPLDQATRFVRADSAAINVLTAALGYRYHYDADDNTYIHPAAAYVLQADGRVSRALTGIGISADDLRLALVEASAGKVGTFSDRVRLLCSGFDPAHGTYNLLIGRLLALAAAATVLTLAGGLAVLLLAGRRRTA
jgi:protein SCO1/2